MKGVIKQTTFTLATLISDVTSMVTAAAGWISTYAETITEQPILLMGIVVSLVGMGVGLIRRLMRI